MGETRCFSDDCPWRQAQEGAQPIISELAIDDVCINCDLQRRVRSARWCPNGYNCVVM